MNSDPRVDGISETMYPFLSWPGQLITTVVLLGSPVTLRIFVSAIPWSNSGLMV